MTLTSILWGVDHIIHGSKLFDPWRNMGALDYGVIQSEGRTLLPAASE